MSLADTQRRWLRDVRLRFDANRRAIAEAHLEAAAERRRQAAHAQAASAELVRAYAEAMAPAVGAPVRSWRELAARNGERTRAQIAAILEGMG